MHSRVLHQSIRSRDLMVRMLRFAMGSNGKLSAEHGELEHPVEPERIIEPTHGVSLTGNS